jgi:multiple sugar transport system substrate-binding protein
MFFSLGANSAKKDEGAKFISFFINDPAAAKVLGVERGIPCVKATRDSVAPSLDAPAISALLGRAGFPIRAFRCGRSSS